MRRGTLRRGVYSAEDAALMGLPHIGAEYLPGKRDGKRRYGLSDGAMCSVCGRRATNAHHVVKLGLGGRQRPYVLGGRYGEFELYTPLFALCGMGNASGCHGMFHAGLLKARWAWDAPSAKRDWESGLLLCMGMKPHDPRLYELGHWVIEGPNGLMREVRGDGHALRVYGRG